MGKGDLQLECCCFHWRYVSCSCLDKCREVGHIGRLIRPLIGLVGPHYASSKSALHGFIHWLAGNVAKKGITINGIAPAVIEDTAMLPGGSAEIASSKCFHCYEDPVTSFMVVSRMLMAT